MLLCSALSATQLIMILRDLASRCDAAWLSVPEHLRFTPEQWPTHLPAKICCVMGKMYLHYLHTHFQIQRMIGKIEGTLMSGLFPIAIKMVATIMKISKTHRTSGIILSDIGETVSFVSTCTLLFRNVVNLLIRCSVTVYLPPWCL